jgi:hypothetical protein
LAEKFAKGTTTTSLCLVRGNREIEFLLLVGPATQTRNPLCSAPAEKTRSRQPNNESFVAEIAAASSGTHSHPLGAVPPSQRRVILVPFWHHAMAFVLFMFEQLFMLLLPELVVCFKVASDVNFPSKPDFVELILSILQHHIILINVSLKTNRQIQFLATSSLFKGSSRHVGHST